MPDAGVVFHPGSYRTTVGFTGDDAPQLDSPTLASPSPAGGGWDTDAASFGDVARFDTQMDASRRAVVPYDHGVVTDWDAMEALLRHYVRECEILRHVPHDALIITETPWAAPRYAPGHRESWLELAFESCERSAVLCASQPLLALIASGRTVGATLSVGHQVTVACTFGDGGEPLHFCRSDVGGADVTDALGSSMAGRGVHFTSSAERATLRDMKEKMAVVASGDDDVPASRYYRLPDGRALECLGEQRVRCYDALFAPPPESGVLSVLDTLASAVLPDAVVVIRSQRVALCGATTLANGFAARVQRDVHRMFDATPAIRVAAVPERKDSEWIGGSILGSLSTSAERFVSKATYDEEGAAVVARRFDHFSC